jgi:hypothetical protein
MWSGSLAQLRERTAFDVAYTRRSTRVPADLGIVSFHNSDTREDEEDICFQKA